VDSVWSSPVALWNTVESAVLGAGLVVWAELAIPRVAGVAVLVATDAMEPSPVCIEGNLLLLGLAAVALGASLEAEWKVGVLLLVANLLSRGEAEESGDNSGGGLHT
jgi:hypothetical protein